jgi:hypothetical protein
MFLIPAIGLLLLILTCCVLGPAILFRGIRDGSPAELLLGSSIVSAGMIGYPLQLAARTILLDHPAQAALAQNLGFLIGGLGMCALCFFTSYALRPGSRLVRRIAWASSFVFVSTAVLQSMADDEGASTWTAIMLAERILVLGWAGLEAATQFRRMAKRSKLGLAEPLLANRYLLAAIASCSTAGTLVFPLLAELNDRTLARDIPAVGLIFGLLAISAALSAWMACVPPKVYVRFIEGRTPPVVDA